MEKEETEIVKPRLFPRTSTFILFAVLLVIPLAFYFLLDQQTGAGFGFIEILFSIAVALFSLGFLVWLKFFMKSRPYLGLIIGLIALISLAYSIFLKYKGPYTNTFLIVSSVVVLIYIGIYFIKFRKANKLLQGKSGFDDSL